MPRDRGARAADFCTSILVAITATIVALATFGIVAPVMHLIGIAFGIAGTVSANANKVASVIGIILNVLLVIIGLGLGWFAISGIGAFT